MTPAEQVLAAQRPFDIFGELGAGSERERLARLTRLYRQLAKALHPDKGGDGEAFSKLGEMYQAARQAITGGNGQYEAAADVRLRAGGAEYRFAVKSLFGGDVSDFHPGSKAGGPAVFLKLARRPADNALIKREHEVLRLLFTADRTKADADFFQNPLQRVTVKAGGMQRAGLIVTDDGLKWYDLDRVMGRHLGGIGGMHESYGLALYFMARHTYLDSVVKRGKKGYLFVIGDERCWDPIDRGQVQRLIGDTLEADVPVADVLAELQEKFEVFFLFASQGAYRKEEILDGTGGWRALLGERAVVLDDAEAVCETIALTIGLMEGTVNLDQGADDLAAMGADLKAIQAAGKALATVGASVSGSASVATTDGEFDAPADTGSGVEAL